MPASRRNQNNGLNEYIGAISDCVAKISGGATGKQPLLVGHSLGGTLAAIFSAWAPASVRGLILLGAPLCFEPATSRFRDALVSLISVVALQWRPFSRVAIILHRHPSFSRHIYMVAVDRHGLQYRRPSDTGNQCPRRALGSRRDPSSRQAGAPDYPVVLSREPFLSRNLEGRRNSCQSLQPISTLACNCNHGRRSGPAYLRQTLYRRDARN